MAGELADGLALVLSSEGRLKEIIRTAHDGARRHGRSPGDVAIACGVMTFVHHDLALAREAARAGLAFFMLLPAYNRLMHNSGFEAEAKAVAALLPSQAFQQSVAPRDCTVTLRIPESVLHRVYRRMCGARVA